MENTYLALATAFSAALVTDMRNNGVKFVKFTDDAPQWMHDAVQAAHDHLSPDDYVYALCSRIADDLTQYGEDGPDDDDLHEIADNAVPCYHRDRFRWLADNFANAGFCDDENEENGVPQDASISDRIALGMYRQARQVAQALHDAIIEQVEEQETV